MNKTVCVVYSDIVAWTRQDLASQIASAQALFTRLVKELTDYGLKPLWKASTGDGFAVAFERADAVRVLQVCADLHDQYAAETLPALRLAVAEGSLESFTNALLEKSDYTGPAVVKARRILDGITAGNILLVDQHLAEDCLGQLPEYLRAYFVEHPDIPDKHGDRHRVTQVLSRVKNRSSEQVLPVSADAWTRRMVSDALASLQATRQDKLFAIDSLILIWLANEWGVESAALKVTPRLPADGRGAILAALAGHSGKIAEYAARYRNSAGERVGEPNNPKVWLRAYRTPMTDRPSLELDIGKIDYWTAKAIEMAFEEGGLRREYENGGLDIYASLPGLVSAHSAIITVDNCLILAQRKANEVDFGGGNYSPSFEEQWNPLVDQSPHDSVLRGLREEFNIDRDHGVYVTADNLRLVAVGREWGYFWQTAILYIVHLPATAATVIECWNSVPPPQDKNEHCAVVAVPLTESGPRQFLEHLLDRKNGVSRQALELCCQNRGRIAGAPTDGQLHPTSARARILIAMGATGAFGKM